ncbi:hypothetical protein D0866_13178 [Hortaea werneckii]|uniref:Uncharacterized protein n=1 Tax=Hortaea werneckii TaxID=91943 RepID=A0A3M6ZTM4_HORWE|nr:hypothetical protein D0866_13178 [Hortaea werneckii]
MAVTPAAGNPNKAFRKQAAPLDVRLLIAKLETHQRRQTGNMSVGASDQPARDASKRASYVPRYAARQFAATTTTATNGDEHKDAMKRAKTVKERPKPSFEAAPRSINPKQLQARLSMGMSENEAMSAAVVAPSSTRPDLGRSNSASSVQKTDKKHRRSRKDRARSDASDLKTKRSVRRPGPPREIESSENTMTAYQPGDAAKRKAEKRSSQAFPGPARPLGYVAEYSLQFADLQAETGKALVDRPAEEESQLAMRPTTLRPQDRPNWTQQSQCGDDMRHALGSNWRRRKSAGDRNEALQALEGSGGAAAAAPPPPRKSTSGAMGHEDQTLISDAVKQINRGMKSKRRQSVMALFRKL